MISLKSGLGDFGNITGGTKGHRGAKFKLTTYNLRLRTVVQELCVDLFEVFSMDFLKFGRGEFFADF